MDRYRLSALAQYPLFRRIDILNFPVAIDVLDSRLQLRTLRSSNATLHVAVFEDMECRHLIHTKLLGDVWRFVHIIFVELSVRVLFD